MELKISSPCPKSWEDLIGNDRIRYCGQCQLNVYNLAQMRPAEVDALVRRTPGRLCGQLYVREDHTATVRDCPRARSGRRWRTLWTITAGALVVIFGLVCRTLNRPDTRGLPRWIRTAANWIDPEKPPPRTLLVGKISCSPPAPPAPPPSGNSGALAPVR
ncbi:MAG TPA: hypothetical protein VKW04_04685 [Planctomycetota bacterium]|nr:hypothetical protein [Planctomycetota bacterium]